MTCKREVKYLLDLCCGCIIPLKIVMLQIKWLKINRISSKKKKKIKKHKTKS